MTEPVEVWLNALVNVAHGAERKQRELASEPVLDTHESIPAKALVERKTRHTTTTTAVNRRSMNASRVPDVASDTGEPELGTGGDGRPPPGPCQALSNSARLEAGARRAGYFSAIPEVNAPSLALPANWFVPYETRKLDPSLKRAVMPLFQKEDVPI